MATALAVPLTEEQIEAACRVHERLKGWGRIDEALDRLHSKLPGFDPVNTLVKAVAINSLYGTNVYAIVRAADHVSRTLGGVDWRAAGPELVERLAAVPGRSAEDAGRKHRSFASKFAHFFIDAERFPILDSYAEQMIGLHLGRRRERSDEQPYVAFASNFTRLAAVAVIGAGCRRLDRYLWIVGQYRAFRQKRNVPINSELVAVFQEGGSDLETAARFVPLTSPRTPRGSPS